MILHGLIVFVAMFAVDVAFTRYTYAVTTRRPTAASSWAAAIVIFNALITLGYVSSAWMILPAMAGGFAGTWVSVKREHV
jgi:hypothetical protein